MCFKPGARTHKQKRKHNTHTHTHTFTLSLTHSLSLSPSPPLSFSPSRSPPSAPHSHLNFNLHRETHSQGQEKTRDRCKTVKCGCFESNKTNQCLHSRRHDSATPPKHYLFFKVAQAEQGIRRRRRRRRKIYSTGCEQAPGAWQVVIVQLELEGSSIVCL